MIQSPRYVRATIPGLSVICVFNNREVREHCLDRSVRAGTGPVAGADDGQMIGVTRPVELVAVDNVNGRYRSAGEALNAGAVRARHDVLVLVHQDVYLHSLARLEHAADLLRHEAHWGLLGACGITADGRVVGRLRDRVVLLGDSAPDPVEVDSLDEVLFMVRRADLLNDPLSEDPDLAWHAYAVELGVRMRASGREVGAIDLAVTHNSLTVNLNRLSEAHARVAELWPDQVPVRTTCGTVGPTVAGRIRRVPVLGRHLWRRQWLQESSRARIARQMLGVPDAMGVIADIRRDVDLLEAGGSGVLHLLNLDRDGCFGAEAGATLDLLRRTRPVRAQALAPGADLVAGLEAVPSGESALITDLDLVDLPDLGRYLRERGGPVLLGVHDDTVWLLLGPAALVPPPVWGTPRARPLGVPVSV